MWGVLKCTVDHILQDFYTLFRTRFRTYKIASLPLTKITSKDDIKGLVSLKFLRPWLSPFALPSPRLSPSPLVAPALHRSCYLRNFLEFSSGSSSSSHFIFQTMEISLDLLAAFLDSAMVIFYRPKSVLTDAHYINSKVIHSKTSRDKINFLLKLRYLNAAQRKKKQFC